MLALLGWWVASSDPKRIKAVKVRKKGCSLGITIIFHRAEGTFILILTAAKPHSINLDDFIFISWRYNPKKADKCQPLWGWWACLTQAPKQLSY
jgi:hypothetical protein